VYRLQGFVGYALDLEFAADEVCVSVSGGDMEGLTLAAQGNHLTIKPKAAPLQTNFTVYTNHRVYRVDYRAVTDSPDLTPQAVMYVVKFLYPPKVVTADVAKAAPSPSARKTPAPGINFDYWYCGDSALKPIAATDDGIQTRITFAPDTEWPAIYLYTDDGTESLVNFSVQGNTAVIHLVAEAYVLRRGNLHGCVGNRALIHAHRHGTHLPAPLPPKKSLSGDRHE
jgi:type IV secretion system protein VirB9